MGIKRDQADHWFSYCVRARANWSCECCCKKFNGPDRGLHCAHIYGRANKSTRWSMDNAVSLCSVCHRRFTENPVDFHSWLTNSLGEGAMELLREKRNTVLKTNKLLRAEISKHYREQARLIEADPFHNVISYN